MAKHRAHIDKFAKGEPDKPSKSNTPHIETPNYNFSLVRNIVTAPREDYLSHIRQRLVRDLGNLGIEASAYEEYAKTDILPRHSVIHACMAEGSRVKDVPQKQLVKVLRENLPSSESRALYNVGFQGIRIEGAGMPDYLSLLGIELAHDDIAREQAAVTTTFAERYDVEINIPPMRIGLIAVRRDLAEEALPYLRMITSEDLHGITLDPVRPDYPQRQ